MRSALSQRTLTPALSQGERVERKGDEFICLTPALSQRTLTPALSQGEREM